MAAAAREHLADTSSKLRLAFSDLHAIDNQIEVLTTGADRDPLLEAAARAQQAAEMAKSQVSWVMKAAGAVGAAAAKATSIVAEAEAAEAAASKAAEAAPEEAASAKEVAAHAAQTAVKAAVHAARTAAKAGATTAALMAAMVPPAPAKKTQHARGGDSRHKSQGTTRSLARAAAAQGEVQVVVKAEDLEVGEDEHEDLEASSDRAEETDARSDGLQREEGDEVGYLEIGDDEQEDLEVSSDRAAEADTRSDELQREEGDEATEGEVAQSDEEEEEEEEERHRRNNRHSQDQEAKRGKRKLESEGHPSRRRSLRVLDVPQPSYAESPTQEALKRRRKFLTVATSGGSAGGEAAAGFGTVKKKKLLTQRLMLCNFFHPDGRGCAFQTTMIAPADVPMRQIFVSGDSFTVPPPDAPDAAAKQASPQLQAWLQRAKWRGIYRNYNPAKVLTEMIAHVRSCDNYSVAQKTKTLLSLRRWRASSDMTKKHLLLKRQKTGRTEAKMAKQSSIKRSGKAASSRGFSEFTVANILAGLGENGGAPPRRSPRGQPSQVDGTMGKAPGSCDLCWCKRSISTTPPPEVAASGEVVNI